MRIGHDRGGALKWSLVGPTHLLLVAINVFPHLRDVVFSFTNAELVGDSSRLFGGAHDARVFTDPQFALPLRRTALFVLPSVGDEPSVGGS